MSPTFIPFDDLKSLTTPPQSTSLAPEKRFTAIAPVLVDWWRNPEPVPVNRRDGPFFGIPIDGSRSFRAGLWVRSGLVGEYDQACLALHGGKMDDKDAHWLKCGTETFTNSQWVNAVVATPWCDVSTCKSYQELSLHRNGKWVYLELVKERTITGYTILIRWAARDEPTLDDLPCDDLYNLREVQAFGVNDQGVRSGDKEWFIGPMVSGLMNDQGAVAEFEGFHFDYLD